MFKFSHLFVAAAVVAVAGTARGDPDMPQRAKTLRVELVRAYGPCVHPNETLGDQTVPACGPVTPLSPNFEFGRRGHGRVQARMGGALGNSLWLQIDLRDVRDKETGKAVDKVNFRVEYGFRITTNFCANGDVCTTTQITRQQTTKACANGRCLGTSVVDLGGFLTPGFDASIEVEQIRVFDPSGNVFAVQGIGRNSSE